MTVLATGLAAPICGQDVKGPAEWLAELQKKFPPSEKNGAAEEMERLGLALGLDWKSDSKPEEGRPSRENAEAYRRAQVGSWLDVQIKTADDSIAAPGPRLEEFLHSHESAIARLVGALERDVPDWGFQWTEEPRRPPFILVIWIERILLADALASEHAGRHGDASELLEASWSLSQSLEVRPERVSQLIAITIAKLQIGVLRKMSEPSFEWLDRMSGETPWMRTVDSLENDVLILTASHGPKPSGQFEDVWIRGWRAAGERLRDVSACRSTRLTEDEIWEPVLEEMQLWKEEGVDAAQSAEVFKDISAESLVQMVRRAARLRVDRELTAKILFLRAEKAAARDHRWPTRFLDTLSAACPEASYEYQRHGEGMSIRFVGEIQDPAPSALALPLSFQVRPPAPAKTRLTPRPAEKAGK